MSAPLEPQPLDHWLSPTQYQRYLDLLMWQMGITRWRAECFLRLWIYLFLKEAQARQVVLTPPLAALTFPQGWVACSCHEAAELFYGDRDRGSDRSAGMMLDKLAALGLIRKQFDGNCTQIEIQALSDLLSQAQIEPPVRAEPDGFDPRCDAIPVANLLANNYHWLNRNTDAVPYRIANILRDWGDHYVTGMRVLRRCDNQNPVGFYALYPTQRESEIKFFSPPSQGLHLSQVTEVDPFELALPGDAGCRSVFIRSWVIDHLYRPSYQMQFLQDAQQTLGKMKQDFPNLWDMHTLIIHPNYEDLAKVLGFQKTNCDPKLPIYWMYQSVDRFLALDMGAVAEQLTAL